MNMDYQQAPSTYNKQVTVIIPAAGQVSDSLLPLSGKSSAAMIPLSGKPVIYWTLSYLRELGLRKFVIAVRQMDSFVQKFVNQVFNRSLDITYIPMARGFLYLVAIIDWYSRYVLSWRLSNTLDAGS